MPELYASAFAAFLLLAATSYRFRKEGGGGPRSRLALRTIATLLLAMALWRGAADDGGAGIVAALIACSLAAMTVVLALSFAPGAVLRPIRLLAGVRRGDR